MPETRNIRLEDDDRLARMRLHWRSSRRWFPGVIRRADGMTPGGRCSPALMLALGLVTPHEAMARYWREKCLVFLLSLLALSLLLARAASSIGLRFDARRRARRRACSLQECIRPAQSLRGVFTRHNSGDAHAVLLALVSRLGFPLRRTWCYALCANVVRCCCRSAISHLLFADAFRQTFALRAR